MNEWLRAAARGRADPRYEKTCWRDLHSLRSRRVFLGNDGEQGMEQGETERGNGWKQAAHESIELEKPKRAEVM